MGGMHYREIALCLRWGIGDVVMQTPALSALRAAAPRARITALGAAPALELLAGDPRVDRVVPVQRFGISHLWHEPDAAAIRRLEDWVRSQHFDLVLDPHAAPAALGRVLWALGVDCRESDQQAERTVLRSGGSGSAALAAGARAGWGVPMTSDPQPSLRITPADAEWAADAVRRLTARHGGRPIAVAPFASHALKRWPAERFSALLDRIATHRSVLLLAAPDDGSAARALYASAAREHVQLIPPQPLTRLAALLARCSALVCNDTGAMHIAAAAGTATVSVFGPSDPAVYAPRGPRHHAVGGSAIGCRHRAERQLAFASCGTHGSCLLGERSCVDRVSVQDVIEALARAGALEERARREISPARPP